MTVSKGYCSFPLFVLGVFFSIPATFLILSSYHPSFQSDFFEDSNRWKRNIGYVFAGVSAVLLISGIICCAIFCCKDSRENDLLYPNHPHKKIFYQSNNVYDVQPGIQASLYGNPAPAIRPIYNAYDNGNGYSNSTQLAPVSNIYPVPSSTIDLGYPRPSEYSQYNQWKPFS